MNNGCNTCGLLPQLPAKPCKPKCFCKPKPRLCKPRCAELGTYRVPAVLGDDLTGEYTATQGLFENMVVSYEANGAKYIYDADGVYVKL